MSGYCSYPSFKWLKLHKAYALLALRGNMLLPVRNLGLLSMTRLVIVFISLHFVSACGTASNQHRDAQSDSGRDAADVDAEVPEPDSDLSADVEIVWECSAQGGTCREHSGDGCSPCYQPDSVEIDAECPEEGVEGPMVCCLSSVRPCEEFHADEGLSNPECVATEEECSDSNGWARTFSTPGLCPEGRPLCCIVRACMGDA